MGSNELKKNLKSVIIALNNVTLRGNVNEIDASFNNLQGSISVLKNIVADIPDEGSAK